MKILKQEPVKSLIEINDDSLQLKLKLSYEIKLNDVYALDINFTLNNLTSIEMISQYFVAGLLKTIVEQTLKSDELQNNYQIEQMNSIDVNIKVNDSNIQDLCKMIGAELKTEEKVLEKNQSQSSMTQNSIKSSQDNSNKAVQKRRVIPKRKAVSVKEFTYENANDSQELKLDEPEPSPSQSCSENAKTQKITKIKPNIKF